MLTLPFALGCQPESRAPLPREKAASLDRLAAPTLANSPPTYRLESDAASALTGWLITGLNGCTCALVRLRAAMLLRLAPPTLVKEPPTYTVLPETAIDRTSPFAAAVQDVRSQLATSIAASRERTCAFPDLSTTWVKVPPMKRVPPLIAIELTRPFG